MQHHPAHPHQAAAQQQHRQAPQRRALLHHHAIRQLYIQWIPKRQMLYRVQQQRQHNAGNTGRRADKQQGED